MCCAAAGLLQLLLMLRVVMLTVCTVLSSHIDKQVQIGVQKSP
jgi:hypothetical protein